MSESWLLSRPRTARQGRPQGGPLDYVEKVITALHRVGVAYGGGMSLSDWADRAEALLGSLERRWCHTEAVAAVARSVTPCFEGVDGDVLVAAAYLHDIGYSPGLVVTGFHALDGARYLREAGEERLAGLVAYHTGSVYEARLRRLGQELGEFDDERSGVSAALSYCDLVTGPDGQWVTPEARLSDVEKRHGEASLVVEGLRAAWPDLMAQVAEIEALSHAMTRPGAQPM